MAEDEMHLMSLRLSMHLSSMMGDVARWLYRFGDLECMRCQFDDWRCRGCRFDDAVEIVVLDVSDFECIGLVCLCFELDMECQQCEV